MEPDRSLNSVMSFSNHWILTQLNTFANFWANSVQIYTFIPPKEFRDLWKMNTETVVQALSSKAVVHLAHFLPFESQSYTSNFLNVCTESPRAVLNIWMSSVVA